MAFDESVAYAKALPKRDIEAINKYIRENGTKANVDYWEKIKDAAKVA